MKQLLRISSLSLLGLTLTLPNTSFAGCPGEGVLDMSLEFSADLVTDADSDGFVTSGDTLKFTGRISDALEGTDYGPLQVVFDESIMIIDDTGVTEDRDPTASGDIHFNSSITDGELASNISLGCGASSYYDFSFLASVDFAEGVTQSSLYFTFDAANANQLYTSNAVKVGLEDEAPTTTSEPVIIPEVKEPTSFDEFSVLAISKNIGLTNQVGDNGSDKLFAVDITNNGPGAVSDVRLTQATSVTLVTGNGTWALANTDIVVIGDMSAGDVTTIALLLEYTLGDDDVVCDENSEIKPCVLIVSEADIGFNITVTGTYAVSGTTVYTQLLTTERFVENSSEITASLGWIAGFLGLFSLGLYSRIRRANQIDS